MRCELPEPLKVFQQRKVMKERTLPTPTLFSIFLLIKTERLPGRDRISDRRFRHGV